LFPLARQEALKYSAGWKIEPIWDQDVDVVASGVYHFMFPTGDAAQVWKWLDQGVPGRYISVQKTHTWRGKGKYKPTLKLRRYRPYTVPGGGYGGTGARYGKQGYRQVVYWTGIRPRFLNLQIAEDVRKDHIRISELAMKKAVRAAQREGS
jgi:hypothetical protein